MRLTKKEVNMIREVAFLETVLYQDTQKEWNAVLEKISEEKHEISHRYRNYLTQNEAKKVYVVNFKTFSGAGSLTFYDCTAEEAEEKALHKLQHGAFGKWEKLEDIKITSVCPDTIYHNQFSDFLVWESNLGKVS